MQLGPQSASFAATNAFFFFSHTLDCKWRGEAFGR